MQEAKVTVVIPNYNGIKYIRDCMDSLRRQNYESFEVLVIDNASKDGSLEILMQEYPEARVIALEENTGFCYAVNLGIRESKTPYVILLNNDTIVKPDFVSALVKTIEEGKDIFSVSAQMLSMEDENLLDGAGDGYNILGWAYARGKGRPASQYDQKTEIFSACGGAAIYRKSVMEQIGYFDENHFAYLDDVDIGYRARIYGYRNLYEPAAKVILAVAGDLGGFLYGDLSGKIFMSPADHLLEAGSPEPGGGGLGTAVWIRKLREDTEEFHQVAQAGKEIPVLPDQPRYHFHRRVIGIAFVIQLG